MAGTAPKISRSKSIIFKLITLFLPFLILGVIELVLRASGYGNSLDLFIDDPANPGYLVINKHVSQRYFADTANATIGNFEPFRKKKQKGAIRIFILGESTTIGYPYMHNGSFHRWLQYRLINMYPGQDFEVINLSMTAVNSYTVADMAKELPNFEPDAVLIYSGHNEFYGALGVGSTSSFGSSGWFVRTLIKLKQLRTVQLIFNSVNRKNDPAGRADRTLMQRMAKDQQIPYHSEKYNKAIEQFSRNLDETCRVLSDKNIPVLTSNLVSNEKDLKPLSNNAAEADSSATKQYEQAMAAYTKGDSLKVLKYFSGALNHDQLRFRAPAQLNQIIAATAKKYKGIFLVDTRKSFQAYSKCGIIGGETVLEHVHPNLKGYSIMSDAFFQSLSAAHILPRTASAQISLVQLQQDMPVTVTDSLFGAYSVIQLKKGWPFFQHGINLPVAKTIEEQTAMDMLITHMPWNDAMDRLMNFYQQTHDNKNALKIAEAVMLEYPQDATFYTLAGKLSVVNKQYMKSANYLTRAFKLTPSATLANALVLLSIKNKTPDLGLRYTDYILSNSGTNSRILDLRSKLSELTKLQQKLDKNPDDKILTAQISQIYSAIQPPELN